MAEVPDIDDLWERAWAYWQSRQQQAAPLQPEKWYTGICPDGRQLLAVFDDTNLVVCWFDGGGRYQEAEVVAHGLGDTPGGYFQRDDYPELHQFLRRRFEYRDGPIRVSPFESTWAGLAVKPLPHWLFRFVLDPYELEGDSLWRVAEDLEKWLAEDDTYVLEAWGNTFFIDRRDGHCTAS